MKARAFLILAVVARTAAAQPELPPESKSETLEPAQPPGMTTPPAADPTTRTEADDQAALTPSQVDSASCLPLDLTPGALIRSAQGPSAGPATPIAWTEFEVRGKLVETPATVHALLEPTLNQFRTSLSAATLPQVAQITARFGYQLIGQFTQDLPDGARLVLSLAPLPLVRKVDVGIKDQPFFGKVLDDEIKRRMGIRRGSYLPWEPIRRQCAMLEEKHRIEEFLFDEGYFDASVSIYYVPRDVGYADVRVTVELNEKYEVANVKVTCPPGSEARKRQCFDTSTNERVELPIPLPEIVEIFEHKRTCFILGICRGGGYSRTQYQKDIQAVKERFQTLGYAGVRVQASDPRTTINRDRKTVNPIITIDPRRRVEVDFEGYDRDAFNLSSLRKQLTFNDAASADDVEAMDSARALTTYLQTRGYFDARVTFTRERVDVEAKPDSNDVGIHYDRIRFQIDLGNIRRVARVEFVGNKAIGSDRLRELLATKVATGAGSLFGTTAAATSAELILDQERIKEAYRQAGYPNATVWPSASVRTAGLDNAALTAALLGVDDGNSLVVRFTIDEGEPTLLTRIVIVGDGDKPIDDALCADVLGELATELHEREVARRSDPTQCVSTISGLKFRYDDIAGTRDRLREYLLKLGRGRAIVDYVAVPFGINRVEARYTIRRVQRLKVGKIIVRGAVRTADRLITGELGFAEGDVLTTDELAEGARKLRNTGLFEAVNIDMPDLDCGENEEGNCNSDTINAIVRVEERYLHRAEVGVEGGLSSQNGYFGTLRWTQGNLFGHGILFRFSGTYGSKLSEVEGTFRLPQWIVRRRDDRFGVPESIAFATEVTGLYRQQQTERFGELTTKGFTVGIARQWPQPRTETEAAHSYGLGLAYDYRVRIRNVDALRPIGADMDQSQVAISTTTGQLRVTFEIEKRIDRSGQLAPLAPEDGHRLELSASYASTHLLGQDDFIKFYAYGAKFFPIGSNLVLRFDGRYDQGYPIGEDVLLPEVERLFAGGDSTVRGYSEDRLKTEIIEVGVPPLDNVSQIRIIPVGGNIRALASVDAQVRIFKILAGAVFSDAGVVTNSWRTTTVDDIRPSVGMGLRALTPFGIGALEYAVPIRPHLGDDPRGRIHFYFAARAQF
ncbi:MAG TPA: POTRA domain-containing protein [Kofleriaceae bacterium]|nr:POTRA domain-containing protein [Kofleriaceae bacterium]